MSAQSKKRRQRRRAGAQATTAKRRTPGQRRAREELVELAGRHPELLAVVDLHAGKGKFHARVRIATVDIDRAENGLPIANDHEDIELWFGDMYPDHPPSVLVDHDRFLGHPHVIIGRILCIYLDTDREWHPALGATGVVNRLMEWLRDAAAGRFDERTALCHPIGGLPPSPRAPGIMVVRQPGSTAPRSPIALAAVNLRSPHRYDLIRWSRRADGDPPTTADALVLRTTRAMDYGLVGVETVGELLARVEFAGGPAAEEALRSVARLVGRLVDRPLQIVIEVAHPADPQLTYLAAAQAGGVIPLVAAHDPGIINRLPDLPIGWISVSDERPEVATRRDSQRPAAAFNGTTVELWGCGGLGSWIAEFVVRAGVSRIVLRDTGGVVGGLLVRQNYVEDDLGLSKAEQLAGRLRAISDSVDVQTAHTSALELLAEGYEAKCDVLIDATINVTVAARLDEWRRSATIASPLLVQVATDPRTATRGLLIVSAHACAVGPATIDDATWTAVREEPAMERFQGFWTPPAKSDQLVPALGCSTPTFHGSAADLACLAGSFVSLIGAHIDADESGAHLIESSHARGPTGGGHHFIPFGAS